MKKLSVGILLTCALFTVSCTTKEPIHRLLEFEYPENSLRLGQIFVYQNKSRPEADCVFVSQIIVTENGIDYDIQQTRRGLWREGYRKHLLDSVGKLLTMAYMFTYTDTATNPNYFDSSELVLRESENLDAPDFSGLKIRLTMDGLVNGSIDVNEKFNRREFLMVMNRPTEVLVFDSNITSKAWAKWLPFLSSETVYKEEVYIGRGLGIVKYSQSQADSKEWWELVAIRRLPESSRPLKIIELPE